VKLLQLVRELKFARLRERRQYPRVDDSLRVHCQAADEVLPSECVSKDISEGGVCLHLYQSLSTGESLKLGICLKDNPEPAWVLGKVVWSRETRRKPYPFEAGIKFDFSDSVFRSRIRNHVENLISPDS
jgi:Tfp pilus assembly protein PilZ